jgi:uncharacterized protein (TIGR02680 family)
MNPLPHPSLSRWQPVRLGLVDLFYYDQEEFAFRDGRLLLRGNNGTGKSKVLALTLPFLLDGDLSAHRVEPDADPKKKMEWNLLLGGDFPGDDRLGYTWIEFGCLTDDSTPIFCTIGCGLKAAKGRGITGHWYFVTEQRIGEDLALVDSAGVALPRDRLEAAIGASGSVYRTAREYRRAIDERLFGLGEQRYGTLVDLLIKIRAPQLSKRPDERGLSAALTEALPPLDQALIADVAEAFRALEEDGAELAAMIEARDASQRYLDTYRSYSCMAARRQGAPLRQSNSLFERVGRDLSEAQAAYEQAQRDEVQAAATLSDLREEADRLSTREQTLRESPEMRSAGELARAAEDARRATERVTEAERAAEKVGRRGADQAVRLADAESRESDADTLLTSARQTAAEHARAARIEHAFADEVDTVLGRDDRPDDAELQRRAEDLGARQQRAIETVGGLLDAWEAATRELAAGRVQTEQLASEHGELTARREASAAELADVSNDYVRAVRAHLEAADELRLAEPAETLAALELWVETLEGANPADLAAAEASRSASAALEGERVGASAERDRAAERAADLDAEIARLESGDHDRPPVPHTRDVDAREQRAGAPLWQVVDFDASLDDRERAGLEAALEVAGILDAWITPDSALLAADTDDVLISRETLPASGRSLRDALSPALDREDPRVAELADESVERILEAIGLGDGDAPVWVSPDGAFRNGILVGSWHKPTATFVGHGAREAARRARLEELGAERTGVLQELARLDERIAHVARRRDRLERELSEMPGDGELRARHGRLVQIEAALAALSGKLAAARAREQELAAAEQAAANALRTDADDLRLPATRSELDVVERALREFRLALAGLWPALAQRDRARETTTRARADLADAEAERTGVAAQVQTLTRERAACVERHATLKSTVGAAIEELQRQLTAVAAELRVNTTRREATEVRHKAAVKAEGAAEGRRGELQRELETVAEQRAAAVDRLRRFAGTGLVQVGLADLEVPDVAGEWGVTVALRLARQIEQELSEIDDSEQLWTRTQQRVTDELGTLSDALRRHGNNASASLREEGVVIEVTFRGHTTTLPALAEALGTEVEDRQRLLDEKERAILENHLVNEVASTLAELISAAERREKETNLELANRPTSTGMRLRLRWVVKSDGPHGLAQARARLLRQNADAWSEDDRAAVGGFLQARIQEVRAQDTTGTWIELLTRALDYRQWHHFTIERHQAGAWKSATGPASGGERVLAASLPLFAAAASYYRSAGNPHAPRVITLDEAFAGVDDNARAKCLGLLASFDLDVVMTSEREWGCYPEVPGLAIAQLSRVDDIPAVLVTRWEWDGVARTRVEGPTEPLAAVTTPDPLDDGPRLWETSITSA